jgi:hypothetical protein
MRPGQLAISRRQTSFLIFKDDRRAFARIPVWFIMDFPLAYDLPFRANFLVL